MSDETPAEVAYRLGNEALCRDLAERLSAELKPKGLHFCLVLSTYNATAEDIDFQNVSYVSSWKRENAARILTELVDTWWSEGNVTEPSVRTMTVVREAVHRIRDSATVQQLLTAIRHRAREIAEAKGSAERAKRALLLASEALAIFDVESRRAEPRKGN